MYLISLVGQYPGAEGDHSHWLTKDYDEARRIFKAAVDDTIDMYEDEGFPDSIDNIYGVEELEYEDYTSITSSQGFSDIEQITISTERGDVVDIYIIEINANGKLSCFPF